MRSSIHLVLAGSALLAPMLHAGSQAVAEPPPAWTLRLESSYVGSADFERGRDASGDAWSGRIELSHATAVSLGWPRGFNGAWSLRLGAFYERSEFGNAGALPLPAHLQKAGAVLSLEYLVNGRRAVMLEVRPGFYFEDEIRSGAFSAPAILAAGVPLGRNFYIIGGVRYSTLGRYPVMPVAGFLWDINDRWTVVAIPPDPKIVYHATTALDLWLGGELAGGSYLTSGSADRPANLRNAVVSYNEWRAGAGLSWTTNAGVLEVGAGAVFQREFDYHRADEEYRTDGAAPYVKIELRTAF
jgi:hypothetical protein